MNELLSLFPILFLLYALQCIAAAPPGTVVFVVDSRLRGRPLRHWWLVGRFRLFLLNPLLPLCSAVYVCRYPFSFILGPAGELRGVDFATSDADAAYADVSFDMPHRFASRSKQLLVDDSPVAFFHSEQRAAHLATFLDKLRSMPPRRRFDLLDRELRQMFDLGELNERLQLFSQCTSFLNSLRFSVFLLLFLLAPIAIFTIGLGRLWLSLLLVLVLYLLLILWTFTRARRRLYPHGRNDDLQHLLTIMLSPFAAIRAIDPLLDDLLEGFHPVAVAWALLPQNRFLQFAEKELRRVKFITHDTILEKSITAFLSRQKLDPQSLLQHPVPADGRSRTYCPACLTQYVIEEGTCEDCGGISLQSLPTVNF
jgi:hypothetical protein